MAFLANPAEGSDSELNRRALAAFDILSGDVLIKYLLALTGGKAEPEAVLSVSEALWVMLPICWAL